MNIRFSIFAVSLVIAFAGGVLTGRLLFSTTIVNPVFAVVRGQEIRESEVYSLAPQYMNQIENQIYEQKRLATEQVIRKKYLQDKPIDGQKNSDSWRELQIHDEDFKAHLKLHRIDEKTLNSQQKIDLLNNLKIQKFQILEREKKEKIFSDLKVEWKLQPPPRSR